MVLFVGRFCTAICLPTAEPILLFLSVEVPFEIRNHCWPEIIVFLYCFNVTQLRSRQAKPSFKWCQIEMKRKKKPAAVLGLKSRWYGQTGWRVFGGRWGGSKTISVGSFPSYVIPHTLHKRPLLTTVILETNLFWSTNIILYNIRVDVNSKFHRTVLVTADRDEECCSLTNKKPQNTFFFQ